MKQFCFLEDDVLFSSKFSKIIGEVEKHMDSNSAVDVVTLFGSADCYWPKVNNKAGDLIYRFDGAEYYGNLAVAFSQRLCLGGTKIEKKCGITGIWLGHKDWKCLSASWHEFLLH